MDSRQLNQYDVEEASRHLVEQEHDIHATDMMEVDRT